MHKRSSRKPKRSSQDIFTWIVNKNSSVLSAPDLISPDLGIAASSTRRNTDGYESVVTFFSNIQTHDVKTALTWSELQSTCGYRCHYPPAHRDRYHRNKRPPGDTQSFSCSFNTLSVYLKGFSEWRCVSHTCFPLCILFLRSTGVLPVVTQTPASVLLYTSFSSITPWPFSCCHHTTRNFSLGVLS